MNRPHHPPGPTPYVVSTPESLARLVDEVRPHQRVAVDTESDGFFRYRAKLCVVQVGVPGTLAVVDTLCGLDLSPLWDLLRDPARTCILHDAEGDVSFMARDHGVTLGALFDTAIAARMLGLPQLGLAGLCKALLDVDLDKTEQKSDWARRPLSREQVRYAAADVAHLHPIADVLAEKLAAAGRTTWAVQSFDRARTRVLAAQQADMDGWRAIKGAQELDPAQLGVLRAAFLWREDVSRRMDMAPFRVTGTDVLLGLARKPPADEGALRAVRGFHPQVMRGPDAGALLAAIRAATPVEGPLFERRELTDEDRVVEPRFEAVRAVRAATATRLGMDVSVVLSNTALRQLAREPPASLDALVATGLLLPWQVEVAGAALVETLARPVSPAPSRRHRGRR